MYYTNGSSITKTFHGVTFGPGETKEVSGIINDPKFVLSHPRQEPPKREEEDSATSDKPVDVPKKRRGRKSSEVASVDTTENSGASDEITIEEDKFKEV